MKIAAHHLNKRGGVLIGDVVGLGKTLMATALARIFEDDHGLETLIICPKNLVTMWEDYGAQYRLRAQGPVDQPGAAGTARAAALSAGASSTRATTCATARASATGPSRTTSSATRAGASC